MENRLDTAKSTAWYGFIGGVLAILGALMLAHFSHTRFLIYSYGFGVCWD